MRLKYLLLSAFALVAEAANFTIINGQIFTPGLAIIDAPQPNTPLGGDTLEVAIDVSGDGKLPLPPYADKQPTRCNNITIFLTSYTTGLNLTITNGTASNGNASLGDVMSSEPGSTVKHVKWTWPACLVGNGFPKSGDNSTARGFYNISIHQSFILNSTAYYTIFDLPISVTNEIAANTTLTSSGLRADCSLLNNTLQSPSDQNSSAQTIEPAQYPWTNGQGTQTVVPDPSASSGGTGSTSSSNPDIGDPKPNATPSDGLGSAGNVRVGAWSFAMSIMGMLLMGL